MRIEKTKLDEDQEIIEITQDVRVGDFILEKGDKIVILEMDDKKKKDDDDDDDDEKDEDKKDKKKKDKKESQAQAVIDKIQKNQPLTIAEKKFVINLK